MKLTPYFSYFKKENQYRYAQKVLDAIFQVPAEKRIIRNGPLMAL